MEQLTCKQRWPVNLPNVYLSYHAPYEQPAAKLEPPGAAKKARKVAVVPVTNYGLDIELKKVQSYEKGRKNRKTLLEQLDRRIGAAS